MGYCGDCEYLTIRHNCKKYKKGLAYSSYISRSISTGAMHERCSECDKDYRIAELEEKIKHQWIPVAERPPENEVRVLVTIMHHKWIADPGHRDQCIHPEWLETCEARRIGEKEWEYADKECEYETISAFSAIGDLNHTFPIDEVLAWMPLPEPYKEAEG